MHVRLFSVCSVSRLCRPLPSSAGEDKLKYGIADKFVNRNPRNLEMMGIAHKRKGWKFQAPRKDYYHKLELRITSNREGGKHTTAALMHSSGQCIIDASTKESAISQHLHSTSDVNASFNIGRVIAYRCHQVGIDSMIFDHSKEGEAVEKFKEAVLDGGITLTELEEQPYPEYQIGTDYDAPS